jgi:hypothetical protein
MSPIPELQILDTVIRRIPVDVMDRLMRIERAAEMLRHDETVFTHNHDAAVSAVSPAHPMKDLIHL